jgi:hypothetical protein
LSRKFPSFEIERLNLSSIIDYHTLIFQQSVFLLLLTHDLVTVDEMIQSTRETLPELLTSQRRKSELVELQRIEEQERLKRILMDRAARKKEEVELRIQSNLLKFKVEALKSLSYAIWVGAVDAKGNPDNGSSWGVLEKNIHSEFKRKVVANILNHYGRSKESAKVIQEFENDIENPEFSEYIQSLGCQIYRGNLRRFSPFPKETFVNSEMDIDEARRQFKNWINNNPRSVLSADRGNVPKEVESFLVGWKTIENLFDESKIFFLENSGLFCTYSDFVFGIHVAFVASKPDNHGLRGQWLISLAGIPPRFSRDLEVLGWMDLAKSKYREQNRFKELLY